MSIRNSILDTLASELTVISGTGVYTTDVKSIKRGIHFIDDYDQFPALSFWCFRDDIESYQMGDTKLRWMYIRMFGITTGVDNVSTINDFEDDVEYFLDDPASTFTYKENVLIDDVIVYESGTTESTDNAAYFLLTFRIKYMM